MRNVQPDSLKIEPPRPTPFSLPVCTLQRRNWIASGQIASNRAILVDTPLADGHGASHMRQLAQICSWHSSSILRPSARPSLQVGVLAL